MLSISKSAGISLLSLPAALIDLSSEGGVISIPKKKFSLHLFPQTYLLKILVQKTRLLVLLKKPIYHNCKTQKL